MSYPAGKKHILLFLSVHEKAPVEFINNSLGKRYKSALYYLQQEKLVENIFGVFQMTDSGKEILKILQEPKPQQKTKHTFNGANRCIMCGVNRYHYYGAPYWYDGGNKMMISPECKINTNNLNK